MVNSAWDIQYGGETAALWKNLLGIMQRLRAEDGCPWDRAQTHESIRQNLIEECYEALEGIDRHDDALLCEELGDVLLQVVFHAQIASEEDRFTIKDVLEGLTDKLTERHEHVFGAHKAKDEQEALERWNRVKERKKPKHDAAARLAAVPQAMPSLARAAKLQGRAGGKTVTVPLADKELAAGESLWRLVAELGAEGIEAEQALRRYCGAYIEAFGESSEN